LVILDNLGIILAGIFRAPTTVTKSVIIKDITDTSKTVKVYGRNDDPSDFFNFTVVRQAQIGKSSTPATRQDVNIGSPFTNGGIEDNRNNSLSFGYNSGLGKIEIPTQIAPTFGSGTIVEVCKFSSYRDSVGIFVCCIFRDVISNVNFISAQTININHEVLV